MQLLLSQEFRDAVYAAWGDADRVAKAGLDECFRQKEVFPDDELDHDRQVDLAIRIGVLAGRFAGQQPQDFLGAFAIHFANG